MSKRIFIDANVLIDLLNKDNKLNSVTMLLFNKLINQKQVLLCSPITFAINYYFLGKQIKDKNQLNEKIKRLFAPFIFTSENANIMKAALHSAFTDLEDAVQYYSAIDAKAEIIITKNYFDFAESAIPVYHPLEYVQQL